MVPAYFMDWSMVVKLKQKIAIITGITGQDGAYLADFLLNKKNYIVYGTYRCAHTADLWRLNRLNILNHANLHLLEYDLTDFNASVQLVEKIQPDEIYNLAAQSFVGFSFEQPIKTANANGFGPLNLLEAIRIINPAIRFFQASTSEMFGDVQMSPQSEQTPFYPRSPYGIAKSFAHWMTIHYCEYYGVFACSGILFNHESPLRGEEFVTRKITSTLSKIKNGVPVILELGNLDVKRDWGHAKDYVVAMWATLQQAQPDYYILATGYAKTVRNFLILAAESAGFSLIFQGDGVDEVAIDQNSEKIIAKINPDLYRSSESDVLVGDSSKAKTLLKWQATTSFEELVNEMVLADLHLYESSSDSEFNKDIL